MYRFFGAGSAVSRDAEKPPNRPPNRSQKATAAVVKEVTAPTAKVVIQAESQAHLDHVLLALSHAVTSYNQVSRPEARRSQAASGKTTQSR